MNPYWEKPVLKEGLIKSGREIVDFVLKSEKGEKLKMEDFKDVFGAEEIQKDGSLVEAIKRNFEKGLDYLNAEDRERIKAGKKRSEALEVILADQIELNDWFGPDATLVRTTEFDDLVNGTDAVAEFNLEKDPERIALAIDASMSSEFASIKEKMERNVKKIIGEEKKPEVKYFRSQINDFKGKLEAIIPVIIGIDGHNSEKLMRLFVQTLKLKANKEKTEHVNALIKEKMGEMERHPSQMIFLKEIQIQLNAYLILMEKNNVSSEQSAIQGKTRKILDIIREIGDSKRDIKLGQLENDGVFKTIREAADSFMAK